MREVLQKPNTGLLSHKILFSKQLSAQEFCFDQALDIQAKVLEEAVDLNKDCISATEELKSLEDLAALSVVNYNVFTFTLLKE